MKRRGDWIALFGLLALTLAFFWRAASGGWTFFHGDFNYLFYPMKAFYLESLKAGRLPIWNPYIGCGYPQLAEGQIGAFYPLNLLLFGLLPLTLAFNYNVILHFALAGIFFYAFLRRRGLCPVAAFIGAAVFEWSGFMISHLQHPSIFTTVAWLPLLFFLWEDGLQRAQAGRESFSRALLAGLVLAIQVFAGFPPIVFYSLIGGGIYVLCRSISLKKAGVNLRQPAALFLVSLLAGITLSAIQSLPTLGLTQSAARSYGPALRYITSYGLVPKHLPTFLFPNFLGSPANGTYVGVKWFWEVCGYLGLVPLFLIGLAAVKRWPRVWPLVVLGLVGLILSFGKGNPIYLLLQHLPVFGYFRAAGRYLLLWTAAGAALAGEGAEVLLQRSSQKEGKDSILPPLLAGLLTACWLGLLLMLCRTLPAHGSRPTVLPGEWALLGCAAALSWAMLIVSRGRFSRSILGPALAIVILADLIAFAIPLAPVVRPSFYRQVPWTASKILPDTSWHRVWSWRTVDPDEAFREAQPPWAEGASSYAFDWDRLRPNLPILWKMHDVEADASLMRQVESYIHVTESEDFPAELRGSFAPVRELANLLGAKYLILRQPESNLELLGHEGRLWLYRNPEARPRAWVVGAAVEKQADIPALGALLSRMFSIREQAMVNMPLPKPLNQPAEIPADIAFEEPRPEEVVLHTRTADDGLLILNEPYDPNWSATMDGAEAPIYQANLLLRGIFLPAGEHTIKFTYEDFNLWVGLRISLLAVLFWGLLTVRAWQKSKRPAPKQEKAKPPAPKKRKRRTRG